MTRSWAYNRFGVLMGTSGRASGPRWPSLRGDVLPMITLFPSQGDFCVTAIFIILFDFLGKIWKTRNTDAIYVIDSLPIAVCDHIRIRRSKLYSDEDFRGYQASKKRYFYGLKIHLMVTQEGQPVECFLTPGSFGDVDALK